MTVEEQAAAWMWAELHRNGSLNRLDALHELVQRFGPSMEYQGDAGNPAINKKVLRHFKRLHGGKAVFMPWPDDYWTL